MPLAGFCSLAVLLLTTLHTPFAYGAQSTLPFPDPQADFSLYQSEITEYLTANPLPGRSPEAVALNLPFEREANPDRPYRGRFLLIHGLSDSPFVWHDMAKAISDRGYDVRAILLPGHGTTPEDLLDISYIEWLFAARKHFELYDDGNVPITLGGFSLGGVLATQIALDNPHVAGLLLFSPAYKSKLDKYLRWSGIYSKFKPWLFGGMILEDNPIKYNSIAINSGSQFYKMTRHLKRNWNGRKLSMPTLMVVSEYDSVVNVDYVRNLFAKHFDSPRKRLMIYSHETDLTVGAGELLRPDQYPEGRLLNQSHLSLMNAPDNPLFGRSRRILVCNGNEFPVFTACMRGKNHWYGAQHTASPDDSPVARTTYNPDFDGVLEAFDRVFGTGG